MIKTNDNQLRVTSNRFALRTGERGAALATAILMLGVLSAIAMTVLAVVQSESRFAGSDLRRTQTFYAAAAGIEKMTSDFSALFQHVSRPTNAQLAAVAAAYPTELVAEGFMFNNPAQTIVPDDVTLTEMRLTQGIAAPALPRVTMGANSSFNGLIASVNPFILTSTATAADGTQVSLTRNMNNYLIPVFQFGMFSDEDIELHPGPAFSFNGRIHANGNIYLNGNVTLLDKVTTPNELIYDVLRNDSTRSGASVSMKVGTYNVPLTMGSMNDGPNISGAIAGARGYFPGSPTGTVRSAWDTTSKLTATGTANRFGGQLLTGTTGGAPLKLPMQLDGNPTRETIKRRMSNDSAPLPAATSALSESRYHTKAEIRILIDDEGVADDSGINGAQNGDGTRTHAGVNLSGITAGGVQGFNPIPLPNATAAAGGGRALWRVPGAGAVYTETALTCVFQDNAGTPAQALTVRGVNAATQVNTTPYGSTIAIPRIPAGAGINGHILIQIVDANGVWNDVTKEILSMGMTEGEPNTIVTLQRPLWAAFTQGSREADGGSSNLADIVNNTYWAADGEIQTNPGPTQDGTYGYLTSIINDTAVADLSLLHPIRTDTPPAANISDWGVAAWTNNKRWNAIVPINVYNPREGDITHDLNQNVVYERGITNVVEINMKNLARWMDGVYDLNLLAGTTAVRANIAAPDGYVVYVSDRRGDIPKAMVVPDPSTTPVSTKNITASNGMVDNLDIYGYVSQGAAFSGNMDDGEDVQNNGLAVGQALSGAGLKAILELPDPFDFLTSSTAPPAPSIALAYTNGTSLAERTKRAIAVAAWRNQDLTVATSAKYFRGSVRLFNGADLTTTRAAGLLSTTLGITVASENMVYIWGNYNTTGISDDPNAGTSSLNDFAAQSHYLPDTVATDTQVPASIVCDAFMPLSRTWFDASGAMWPDEFTQRPADKGLPSPNAGGQQETSVRAGIIAGNNLSAIGATPDCDNGNDSRLSGGIHNFPRFIEDWVSDDRRWNFVGAFVPLFHSTQALGPWWYIQGSGSNAESIYGAPIRNWAFDVTFTNPNRLPPGTPQFQHIEPTGFREIL